LFKVEDRMPTKIMLIAGEASGDVHGGALAKALSEKQPALELFGVGGDRMKSAGVSLYYHISDLAYIGFAEVARHYFHFRKIFYHLLVVVQERRPDLIILIDYPGFNLRFAKKAKKLGMKIFYFIAPQVWAWGQSRAKKMTHYIDEMAVLFRFEVEFFSRYGLKTHYVGHPLVEQIKMTMTKNEFCERFRMHTERPILGLFPGSRWQEVQRLLPVMMETARLLLERHPQLQIAISKASALDADSYEKILLNPPNHVLVAEATYELMKYSHAGIVASGTATLEMGFWGTPFVIVYRVSPISYLIGKRLVKIPNIGLVNVVLGGKAIPELIQESANPALLSVEVEKILFDQSVREKIKKQLSRLPEKLGPTGAIERTADHVLAMLK
jgi:lipid-A-disaccharide synthase